MNDRTSKTKLQTRLREIAESLLCRGGTGHYCPNCDNTTFDAAMSLKMLADQLGADETTASESACVYGFQADPVDVMRGGAVVYGSLTARDPNDVARELWTVTTYWRRTIRSPEEPTANLGANIRHEGGVPVCGWCGFAMITNEPRQCCSQGRAYDAASTFLAPEKANERRGTPEEEADWAEFGDFPRCWRCNAPVIAISGSAPGCIRNCPPSPKNGPGEQK